jgi:hypothetical protein
MELPILIKKSLITEGGTEKVQQILMVGAEFVR